MPKIPRLFLPFGNAVCIALLLFFTFAFLAAIPTSTFANPAQELVCAKKLTADLTPGTNIVKAVFTSINSLLSKIGGIMYLKIVNSLTFQFIISAAMGLYITIYGAMVMFNLASHSLGEIISRLIRLSIFYGLLIYGVSSAILFDKYIGQLFLGGMNQLIAFFANAAVPGAIPVTIPGGTLAALAAQAVSGFAPGISPEFVSLLGGGGFFVNPLIPLCVQVGPVCVPLQAGGLDTAAVQALFIPMDIVFRPFFLISILGLLFCGFVGWCLALAMAFAFYEFCMMTLGALITYIRSVVGLLFLFGVGPIFIAFLLFQKTRQVFFGWLNLVIGFALAPVMLLAFLSFYSILIVLSLNSMFANVDFCWVHWFSMKGDVNISWWRPALKQTDGSWLPFAGDWVDASGVPLPPPISIAQVLFFFILCHLGKNFSEQVVKLSDQLTDGLAAGSTHMDIGGLMKDVGRGGTGASGIGGAFSGGGTRAGTTLGATRAINVTQGNR
jgi:type IV secretory pathway VirB6-like protein